MTEKRYAGLSNLDIILQKKMTKLDQMREQED